ncbi:UDP-N-acetylmuramoyl-tripeptide--D-alanyl-D-alanine ligase [Aestuariivita boseongensis]|uniref:UDP-N-acetylmuramoyl-tripeptide--D-alanyl-D- alanine ligase n=1 Tax=Aestuariivita boseongensis TaxID=1470562 RepID=UPI0006831F22|nr:UDP-N-acetylmuramoyl-tripeptide--D-alanyl-D-alanine ligase [Aestuariivita boseongensis]
MSLWTASEAAAATGGRATGNWEVTGISIDTRTIEPGDLFVALKAARDGHDFVAQALDKGAGAAMVSRIPDGVDPDAPLLIVDDVQTALEALGRAARARTSAQVVAITGSVGKTSTKEMIARMLGDQGKTHASVASYNNHWGVPLTLARMPRDTEYAVIEIGMNHPGEIAPLAKMAQPHVAMITTVGKAHLENFPNEEGIAIEKASILDGLLPGGAAVLNADIPFSGLLHRKAQDVGAQTIGFGRQAAEFTLTDVKVQGEVTVIKAMAGDDPLLFKLNTPGTHFAMNALGALACVDALNADMALAAQSLGRWSPYKGRGVREVIQLDAADENLALTLIDDSYNANPDSMRAALDVLAASTPRDKTGRVSKGRRIAILGDMKELGAAERDMHAALAGLPSMAAIDKLHTVGPLMNALHAALPEDKRGLHCDTAAEMAEKIRARLDSGDVVLVKASLSTGLGVVVDAIRKMGQSPSST